MLDPKKLEILSNALRNFKALDLSLDDLGGYTVQDLLQISLDFPFKQVGWRAAWILEIIVLKDANLLQKFYPALIEALPLQLDWSSLRSYTKILMEITKLKNNQIKLSESQKEIIIENTFNWMIHPDCALAVRCNCMDILYNLSKEYDWIQEELVHQIQSYMKNPSPAIASRASKILKRILKA